LGRRRNHANAHQKFVLDKNTYAKEQLLDAHLAKYQGPAVLAYNNAIFTEDDFSSLSSVGDSMKAKDMSSTGKFGRGFNSVSASVIIIHQENLKPRPTRTGIQLDGFAIDCV
jgi:sacsin